MKGIWPVAVLAAAALAFYFIFDPLTTSFMPRCLFNRITGLQCVGCGSQRMLHALLHGDIQAAFHANALALVALPLIPFLVWLESSRLSHPALYARVHTRAAILLIAAVLIAWFIVRNIIGI